MSLSRFSGLMYTSVPVPEDHRKPNIIRGGTNSKSKRPPPKAVKTLSGTNHSTIAIAGSNGMQLDQGYAVQTTQVLNEDGSSPQIYFTDEIHQLIQPSEISPVSQGQGLVQAAIQTDSGSYIVLLKEDEIANLQSQTATPAGGQEGSETFNHSDLLLTSTVECQSSENSEEAISVMSVSADEEIIAAVQNISSDEPHQQHEEGSYIETTEEGNANIGNGLDQGGGEGVEAVQITAEGTQFTDGTQQYILFQLPDGNSYFVPTSSLDGQSVVVDGSCDQIVVDENGEQVIQYVSTDSGTGTILMDPSTYWKQEVVKTTTPSSRTGASSRAKKRESSENAKTGANKRLQVAKPNGSHNSSIRNSQHVSHNFYSKPLPVSRSAVSTIAKQPTAEELKPRPFRFDMPEEDLLSIEDSSTDYLSLVIQQFQKENCVNK